MTIKLCFKPYFLEEHYGPIQGQWHLFKRVFFCFYRKICISDRLDDIEQALLAEGNQLLTKRINLKINQNLKRN